MLRVSVVEDIRIMSVVVSAWKSCIFFFSKPVGNHTFGSL